MAEVGTLTWIAEIQEIAQSKREAEEMNEGLEGLAGQARETEGAMDQVGDSSGRLGGKLSGLEKGAGFLVGGLTLLSGQLLMTGARMAGMGTAAAKLRGILAGLYAWIAAGGISGAISTLLGWGSAFISWLAAGSVGALAFAAAIGAVIGLFVVWILKITGVLDWITKLGSMLKDSLPGWANDALLAVISIFAGGLALLGALILGFMEGGLQGAIDRGKEVLGIFGEAWGNLFGNVMETANGFKEDIIELVTGLASDLGETITEGFSAAFNTVIPEELKVPELELGGGSIGIDYIGSVDIPKFSIGGQTIDLPQLATGGQIKEAGAAQLHEDELVLPADVSRDVIDAIRGTGGGGGSGGGEGARIVIEEQIIEIGDQQLDIRDLDRGAIELLADLVAERQGDELTTLLG